MSEQTPRQQRTPKAARGRSSDKSARRRPSHKAERRRLSGQDAVFVYAETPTMPMHTMGTTIIDGSDVSGGFGFDEIASTIASRLHQMPPFRQRLLEVPLGLGHPILVDDPDFDLSDHLHHIAVPAPGTLRELAALVSDLAGKPLDRSRPLWEMWAVEGLKDGRIALVTKMHHCMIDGASGSSQMAQLMDLEPNAEPPRPTRSWRPPPLPTDFELARESLGSRLVNPLEVGRLGLATFRGLRKRREAQLETARSGEEPPPFVEETPVTPFNRAITTHRSVAYGSASLDDLKRVKNAFRVTVNDAVLAACTISVGRYLEALGELPDMPLVCLVPGSTKSAREKEEFSNKVSTMMVRLPVQLHSVEEVVRAVHRETSDAKHVFQAIEEDLIPQWMELAPPLLTHAIAQAYSELDLADRVGIPANLVVSNMMGPPLPLYFGGARVEAVYPMGPVSEGMGLNLTVLSNMGRVDLGVLACRECVRDPQEIADGFARAVGELRIAADKKLAAAEA
jgi:WS/DGAT/MGAT family acyltransferase